MRAPRAFARSWWASTSSTRTKTPTGGVPASVSATAPSPTASCARWFPARQRRLEPVANALTGAGGDGRGAAEAREGRLAAAAAVVRPGQQRLGGRDWADAALGEQQRRELGDTCLDLTLELAFFGAERLHATGKRA